MYIFFTCPFTANIRGILVAKQLFENLSKELRKNNVKLTEVQIGSHKYTEVNIRYIRYRRYI